jgi:glycine betaine/proline transport system permease protein
VAANSRPADGFARALSRRPLVRFLFWFGLAGFLILLGWLFNGIRGGFVEIPVEVWVNVVVDWLIVNLAVLFDGIKLVTQTVLNSMEKFLIWLPWWVVLTSIVIAAWRLAGPRVAIFSGAAMYFIGTLGLWALSMETLALIATAVLISIFLGVPTGILSAGSDRVDRIVRPVLDVMQTMPAFVLGIRQVPKDLVEAAHTFGSTSFQLLIKVQLPLALPSIMAGINQTIMLSLSMVVLAAMIAAGGLGREVIMALGQVDIGRGFVAGAAIVLVAMILDRITQSLARKRQTASL